MNDLPTKDMVDRDKHAEFIDFLDTCIDHEPTELDRFILMLDRDEDE